MATLKVRLTGDIQLLMHNGQMSDPENPFAQELKAITVKKKKTLEDYAAIKKVEFRGGLYWDEELGPYVPKANLKACLVEGGRISRQGTDLERAVSIMEPRVKLEYKGPREIDKMFADPNFVNTTGVSSQGVKGGGRTQRTRPMFPSGWHVTFTILYSERVVDRDGLLRALQDAAELTGLMDGRPDYGKFSYKVLEG